MTKLRTLARALFLPTLSGVLYFLSWIGFGIWPLAFVCLVPLLWDLQGKTPRQAFFRGWWMGFVTHLGGYTWIIYLLQVFAYLPRPIAFLGYLLVCAGQGGLFGVCAFLLRHAQLRSGSRLTALLPIVLCAVEWAYPLLFQSYTGVALVPALPLVQIADLGGVILLTALQALANGAIADTLIDLREGRTAARGPLLAAVLALAGATIYGRLRMAEQEAKERAAPQRRVGIAQPDVGEAELHKNPMASVHTLWEQTAELHGRGAELVVWPETGFNEHSINLALPQYGRYIQGNVPVSLIAGVIRAESRQRFWNSAVLISPEGALGDHYDKIELLAFGEYIPLGDIFPQIYQWTPMTQHLSRGETTAPLHDGPWRFATFICYEDILPRLVQKIMADHGDGRAHAMVNLTNDSWYGAGHEQEQHLILAAVRSIEHRRWLIRATSTGISAFVDSMGRVVQRIARNTRGLAVRDVPMLEGTTPYETLGDWPGYLSAALLAGLFLRARLRSRKAKAPEAPSGQAKAR